MCRLEDRKKTRNTKPEVTDEKLIELQKKLEAKKMERLREQQKAKIIPTKKSSQRLKELNAAKVNLTMDVLIILNFRMFFFYVNFGH